MFDHFTPQFLKQVLNELNTKLNVEKINKGHLVLQKKHAHSYLMFIFLKSYFNLGMFSTDKTRSL